MEKLNNSDVLMNKLVLLEIEIVVLGKMIECRISAFADLKKLLSSLKEVLNQDLDGWYDFEGAMIFDPAVNQFLDLNYSLKDFGFRDGKKLIVY